MTKSIYCTPKEDMISIQAHNAHVLVNKPLLLKKMQTLKLGNEERKMNIFYLKE